MLAKILVVEDEASVAVTLRGILEAEGYHVEEAANALEALARIEQAHFDAAVIDVRIGEMDGVAVLQRLKEASPGTTALVLTGAASLEIAIRALRAGADDFLVKPIDIAELKASITRARHWRAWADDLLALNAELRRLVEERDALRQVAEERAARLEQLDRLKEDFIATASHDLKTPLTSIKGYTQLLLRHMRGPTPEPEQAVEWLAVINDQATAMARLLDSLLDASRIQAGSLDLRMAPCELGECLAAVLAILSTEERERVDLVLDDAPLAGNWERDKIEQVLANLVGNALKYSPESERVRVVVERRPGEVEVAVGDRGMGIPPEELRRLFERFHRTSQAHASGLPGTGLGLYICRGIIAAHGGRLWAESPGVGLGATFRFTLPIEPPKWGG